jgi:hypothetical protein
MHLLVIGATTAGARRARCKIAGSYLQTLLLELETAQILRLI